jgi:ABC-type Fe3+ transport system permease subunit
VQIASTAPAWLDPLLRSRFSVCFALALHFLPITCLIAMRAFGMTSSSWTYAAAIAGISLPQYLFRVLGPILLFPFLFSIGIVGLLATTYIATVLLLRPPGEDSLPIQIFTIMANAPETFVSSLCTMYFVISTSILLILIFLLSRKTKK